MQNIARIDARTCIHAQDLTESGYTYNMEYFEAKINNGHQKTNNSFVLFTQYIQYGGEAL